MMHDHEESDPAIVARKPANRAGAPAAERGERRVGTEGNADQSRTCRAQDRESVSQALARVRQAARLRKKERFTALHHHLSPELLRTAFLALKRNAAPGVDGLSWR
jgi:RNA-directed DNA polymerase